MPRQAIPLSPAALCPKSHLPFPDVHTPESQGPYLSVGPWFSENSGRRIGLPSQPGVRMACGLGWAGHHVGTDRRVFLALSALGGSGGGRACWGRERGDAPPRLQIWRPTLAMSGGLRSPRTQGPGERAESTAGGQWRLGWRLRGCIEAPAQGLGVSRT